MVSSPMLREVSICLHVAAAGIYHGKLDFESNSDDLIDGAQLLPYPVLTSSPSLSPTRREAASAAAPMSISLTEFHFLLLYRDRVLGISNLNEQLAYEELLPLVGVPSDGPKSFNVLKSSYRNPMSTYGV